PCASRCRRCASGSASPGSSPRCRVWATASTPAPTPRMPRPTTQRTRMARPPGLGVRVKLTISYAAFLMLAGVLLLAVVWAFLLRYVPPEAARTDEGFFPGRNDLIRAFLPAASGALVALLILALVGGWFLAGRMLAPLRRITDATRL